MGAPLSAGWRAHTPIGPGGWCSCPWNRPSTTCGSCRRSSACSNASDRCRRPTRVLLAQQRGQRLARPMETNLHCGRGHRQQLRNFLRRALLDVPQHENRAIVVWQLVDARTYGRARLLLFQQLIGRCAPVRELLDVMTVLLKGRQQRVDGFFRFPPLRPQPHERGVDHDPMQQFRKLAVSLELLEPSKGAQVGGLDNVPSVFLVVDESSRNRQQSAAEGPEHGLERLFIACAEPDDQRGLFKCRGTSDAVGSFFLHVSSDCANLSAFERSLNAGEDIRSSNAPHSANTWYNGSCWCSSFGLESPKPILQTWSLAPNRRGLPIGLASSRLTSELVNCGNRVARSGCAAVRSIFWFCCWPVAVMSSPGTSFGSSCGR